MTNLSTSFLLCFLFLTTLSIHLASSTDPNASSHERHHPEVETTGRTIILGSGTEVSIPETMSSEGLFVPSAEEDAKEILLRIEEFHVSLRESINCSDNSQAVVNSLYRILNNLSLDTTDLDQLEPLQNEEIHKSFGDPLKMAAAAGAAKALAKAKKKLREGELEAKVTLLHLMLDDFRLYCGLEVDPVLKRALKASSKQHKEKKHKEKDGKEDKQDEKKKKAKDEEKSDKALCPASASSSVDDSSKHENEHIHQEKSTIQ